MRIKAFTLIEIIIVIILIGVISFLTLQSYTGKSKTKMTIEQITTYIKQNGTLFIYGDKCKKNILLFEDNSYELIPNFDFKSSNKVFGRSKAGLFYKVDFGETVIKKKKENICFSLPFKDGKFFNKFLIATKNTNYLFLPLFQEIKRVKSLDAGMKMLKNEQLALDNMDSYYE